MNTSEAVLIYRFLLKGLSLDIITLSNMNNPNKGAMDVGGN